MLAVSQKSNFAPLEKSGFKFIKILFKNNPGMLSPVALKFSPWVRQLISLMFIALMVVKASATVQCTLSSLSPSMGPHSGGTTVSINVACNTDDGELMNKLFDSVRAYFGFTQTSILSVSYTGFVTTHNTGLDEPPQIAWTYSVIVM